MGEPHVISALVSKRAELEGKAIALRQEAASLKEQVVHIDHVLAIFGHRDPPRKPKRHTVQRFKRRELTTLVRELSGGTDKDVARRIIERKGWDTADPDLLRTIAVSVKSCRKYNAKKGCDLRA